MSDYEREYEIYLKEAWMYYYKAIDAEGDTRKYYLRQAENVLGNIPCGFGNSSDLQSRINSLL